VGATLPFKKQPKLWRLFNIYIKENKHGGKCQVAAIGLNIPVFVREKDVANHNCTIVVED